MNIKDIIYNLLNSEKTKVPINAADSTSRKINGEHQSSAKNFQSIVVAINSLADKIEAKKHVEDEERKWNHRTSCASILYTFITFILLCVGFYQAYISKESFIVSNRAYVFFNSPTLVGEDQTLQRFGILVGMGNSGNTPTRNLSYETSCILLYITRRIIPGQPIPKMQPAKSVLGPKVSSNTLPCSFVLNQEGTMTGDNGISGPMVEVFGRAIYYDVLQPNIHHETRFCYLLEHVESGTALQNLSAISQPCPYWNCADAECKEDKPWVF